MLESSAILRLVILWRDGLPMLRIAAFKHACMGLKIRRPHDLVKVERWILPNLAIVQDIVGALFASLVHRVSRNANEQADIQQRANNRAVIEQEAFD